MANASDLKMLTLDQLDDELLKLKKEQFNLRFQRATGQLGKHLSRACRAPRYRPYQNSCADETRG